MSEALYLLERKKEKKYIYIISAMSCKQHKQMLKFVDKNLWKNARKYLLFGSRCLKSECVKNLLSPTFINGHHPPPPFAFA
jgi:hypothetical protein